MSKINELLHFNTLYESYVGGGGEPSPSFTDQEESNIRLRNQLDEKLKELYKSSPSTMYYEHHKELDQNIYIHILLTILATSLLYLLLVG